ncbi:hypothetical protein JCM11641_006389 [Rhodosporidiobolus odoratus]
MFPKSKIHVGAVGAMDSRFFAYCFEALVPKDLDMYIVETDLLMTNRAALDSLRDNDALMRSLLRPPQEPAVLRVSVVAVLFDDLVRGAMNNRMTSQFLGVPVISVPNILLPHMIHH